MKIKTILLLLPGLFFGRVFSQQPEINKGIISYVSSVIGQTVDRGECWDLANQALTRNNAEWNHQFVYGKVINPKKDTVYPGDIIHFNGVTVKFTVGTTVFRESYKQHTAIVYQVMGTGNYQIAHQNTGYYGKKVGLNNLNLDNVTAGKLIFYRPVPAKE